ncbi:hypothetical protein NWE58_05275 [Mycoplasmopsis felis]|nr:hypothetical protein [Mycoplasmopsis felis]UWV83687.1 hypothetical protein NWE58_05275 [Mycoplasmopsis felis]
MIFWYSPEKFKSISGTLSALNPKKVSKGIELPSLSIIILQFGQFLSSKSKPDVVGGFFTNSKNLQLLQI